MVNAHLYVFMKLGKTENFTVEGWVAHSYFYSSDCSAPADRLDLALEQVETLLEDRVEELGVHAQVAEAVDGQAREAVVSVAAAPAAACTT